MKPVSTAHNSPRIALFGARGYSGLELAKLLLAHPSAELLCAFATETKGDLSQFFVLPKALQAKAKAVKLLAQSEWKSALSTYKFDVAFLATPAEVSMKLAPELLAANVQVIDLSGAYRLPSSTFEKWYGHAHESSALIANATYGLVPWATPTRAAATLVANPGCYATSILMALVPLLKAGIIASDSIVIDAKSGTTGAGKKAAENLLFSEVDGECRPYRVGKHQHLPEIVQGLKMFAGVETSPVMTTHLLPVKRGILSSIYLKFSGQARGLSREAKLALVEQAYAEAYPAATSGGNNDERGALVEFGALATNGALASLSAVVGSPRTQISFEAEGDNLYVFSVIDNLLKGAASQAVENLNLINGWPPSLGLDGMQQET